MDASENRLLARLSPTALAALGHALEPVELRFKEILMKPDEPVPYVHFPVRGLVSLVAQPEPGDVVEFATVGREGFVGLPVFLGAETMPTETLVQIPGAGFRIKSAAFRSFLDQQPDFRALLMRYTMALLIYIAQTATCNRLHDADARCARWLLHTDDRMDGHTFSLTQEFLSQMLGVHRPTVSIAAATLQKAGLITYRRGVITIVDRQGLEEATCRVTVSSQVSTNVCWGG